MAISFSRYILNLFVILRLNQDQSFYLYNPSKSDEEYLSPQLTTKPLNP
jgi:hypothetical protein